MDYAKRLLDDGASYHEASSSSGVPRTTLRDRYPGMGMDVAEAGSFARSIQRDPKLWALHREIGLLGDNKRMDESYAT
jgi:hypothetical protein